MNRFKTLMLREWMQHQRGWLILVALPILIVLVAGIAGHAQVNFADHEDEVPTPLVVALGVTVGIAALTFVLAWGAALLQSPGLARRDIQDRSVEFWLSLPVGHAQSLGAMLLMHLLVLPWAALGVGLAAGLLVSLPLVAKVFGIGAWFALPWVTALAAVVALALRLTLGLLLATLWLSPLILGTMAASAWLKRWGVPAVAGVVVVGGTLLDRIYGNPIVWEVLRSLGSHASRALIAAERDKGPKGLVIESADQIDGVLAVAPHWLLIDAGHALAALASPTFVAALAAGALGFALLVLRRQRGA